MVDRRRIVVIEGPIGVGKTTMGEILEEDVGIPLFRELTKKATHELLDRFYADQKRWAFTLQIHFLNERFRMIKESVRRGAGALDRSIFGDRIFAALLHDDGDMTDEELATYDTLLDNMLEHAEDPDLLVYLDCSPETALARIKERDRGKESAIEPDYLANLNRRYLEWYDRYERSPKVKLDTEQLPLDTPNGRKTAVAVVGTALGIRTT